MKNFMTNKKLFFIGLLWIALFFGIFVIGLIKESPGSFSSKTLVESWSYSWCGPQDYPFCDNTFTDIILGLWLLPSIFFAYVMVRLRRNVFLVGVASMIITVVVIFADGYYSSFCYHRCDDWLSTLFPIITLIPFSILLVLFREEVFRAWFNFTKWWLPLSIFLTLITPGGSGGGFGVPSVFDKGLVAFVLSALFFIISLIIIVRKSLKLRGK